MDGTGLSTVPPKYLAPLLQKIPFSALNVGNHELYFNDVVDYMMMTSQSQDGNAADEGFIASWGGNYLASNVDYVYQPNGVSVGAPANQHTNATGIIPKSQPFGDRYTFLHGRNSNTTILTFGFLYNFLGHCNHTRVRLVEDVLQEQWFVDVLSNHHYDAIIVLAHMDAVDPLVYTILNAIRSLVGPLMPIQFLTGHSHRRHHEVLDPFATSFEAGRYMDTIGFASFPTLRTVIESSKRDNFPGRSPLQSTPALFQHDFLNANVNEVAAIVFGGFPGDHFSTPRGRAISAKMQQTQQKLGLLDVLTDCAPHKYELAKPLNDTSSLWWLYINEVIPRTLFPRLLDTMGSGKGAITSTTDTIPLFLQGTGALRYDLMGPTVVVDDIIAVSPFRNPIYQVGNSLTAQELRIILDSLEVDKPAPGWESAGFVKFGVAGNRPTDDDGELYYDLYTVEFHVKQVTQQVIQAQSSVLGDVDQTDQIIFAPQPLFDRAASGKHPPKRLETTQLWMEYARTKWKCPDQPHGVPHTWFDTLGTANLMHEHPHMNSTRTILPSHAATLSLICLVVATAVAFTESIRRRQRRSALHPQASVGTICHRSHSSNSLGENTPLLLQLP